MVKPQRGGMRIQVWLDNLWMDGNWWQVIHVCYGLVLFRH